MNREHRVRWSGGMGFVGTSPDGHSLVIDGDRLDVLRLLSRHRMDGAAADHEIGRVVQAVEETGQLDKMLLKVSDTYDTEVRNTIDRLLSVFTPVVTLFLAVLIGTIVLSVLLAILSVNDLVG